MKNMALIAIGLLLTGCLKEELPVPAVPRGEASSLQHCLGPGYQQQAWIDLATASVVAENNITAWDLMFESRPEGWRIMLNGGRLMLAWNTGHSTIDAAVDPAAVAWNGRIDAPSGHPDSTACGDWRSNSPLFIIDMGYDATGNPLGQRRLRPIAVTADAYTVEIALADGSGAAVITIPKDPQRTWVHYRFGQGVVQVAPPDGQWDIVLTKYTHIFRDIELPYLVVGALIDGTAMRAARIPDADFDAVTLADTLDHPFRTERDIIGFDWKDYSFETSSYTCFPRQVYILRNANGAHFKLHFLDFYGSNGQPGCPLFAVKQLD